MSISRMLALVVRNPFGTAFCWSRAAVQLNTTGDRAEAVLQFLTVDSRFSPKVATVARVNDGQQLSYVGRGRQGNVGSLFDKPAKPRKKGVVQRIYTYGHQEEAFHQRVMNPAKECEGESQGGEMTELTHCTTVILVWEIFKRPLSACCFTVGGS